METDRLNLYAKSMFSFELPIDLTTFAQILNASGKKLS